MIYCETFLISALVISGGISAYTDLRNGVVPNRLIVIGLMTGALIHIALLCLGASAFYPMWTMNMLIADAIATAMYFAKIWAAGDAKLFMLLYFLIPPRFLSDGTLAYGIIPYIFIFLPALAWTFVDSGIRYFRKEPRTKKLTQHQPVWVYFKNMLIIFAETTGLYCEISLLFPKFAAQQELLLSGLMMIYAYVCGSYRIMRKWYIILIHGLIAAMAWLLHSWQFTFPGWYNYLLILILFLLQRVCALYNYQLIPTSEVKRGMILSAETVMRFRLSRVNGLPADPSEELTARITEDEAKAVVRWEKSSKGEKNIWIVRKIPFAIMITIGYLAWVSVLLWGR